MNAHADIFRHLRLLSDQDLVARLFVLATREREATALLVAHLAEMDARRLCLSYGFPSLFMYCTQELHLSEHAAYLRIAAARVARRFPVVLDRLAEGSVHLTSVRLLAPHLTEENHERLLEAARHRTRWEVEELVAALRRLPEVPATIRRIPGPDAAPKSGSLPAGSATIAAGVGVGVSGASSLPGGSGPGIEIPLSTGPSIPLPTLRPAAARAAHPASTERPVVAPLAPGRYRVQFTASADLCEKLRRAQDLLRHQIPDGDPAAVFDRALTVLVEQLERKKTGATSRPVARRPVPAASEGPGSRQPRSRYIPAEVRRRVWARDGGRCAFTGRDGYRCPERGKLEFHHVEPYARGGPATVENISLRCRSHNGHESERVFGAGRGPVLVREKALRWGKENRRIKSTLGSNRVRTISSEDFPDGVGRTARSVRGRRGVAVGIVGLRL